MNKKILLMLAFFVAMYFFPLFPILGGINSKLNYIPIVFFVFLAPVMRFNWDRQVLSVFLLLSALFFLHGFSELIDPETSKIHNVVATMVAVFFPLVFYALGRAAPAGCEVAFAKAVSALLGVLLLSTFGYSLLEVFLTDRVDFIVYALYKRREVEILSGSSVSFFSQSYFAAHIYILLFCYSFVKVTYLKSILSLPLLAISIVLVMLTQSKSGIAGMGVSTLFMSFIVFKLRTTLLIIFSLIVALFWFVTSGYEYLSGFRNIYLARSILDILSGSSGSLEVRLSQVLYALNETKSTFHLLGAGVGRSVLLESWVALNLYKYGIGGVLLFVGLWMILLNSSYRCYRSSVRHEFNEKKRLASIGVVCFGWFASIPVVSISSSIYVFAKNEFMVFFFLGICHAITYFNLRSLRFSGKIKLSPG